MAKKKKSYIKTFKEILMGNLLMINHAASFSTLEQHLKPQTYKHGIGHLLLLLLLLLLLVVGFILAGLHPPGDNMLLGVSTRRALLVQIRLI